MSNYTTPHTTGAMAFLYQKQLQELDLEKVYQLREWLPLYLDKYVKPGCSKNTYANYYSYMSTHILPILGDFKLTDLTTPMIQEFVLDKLDHGRVDGKGGLSVKTVSEILLFLKQSLKRACFNGEMLYNPCESVYPPKEEKHEVACLEEEEQEILEESITSGFTYNSPMFIQMALASGMRIGELCALKQGDIDFRKKMICVDKSLGRVRNIHKNGTSTYEIFIGKTKNKKQRYIPMNEDLEAALRQYFQTMPARLRGDEKPIFINRHEKPMEPCAMRYHFRKQLKKVNLQNIHFHILRHTFATRCLEVNMEMKVVSKILGHSSIGITMDLYTHVTNRTMHAEMAKLNRNKRELS